MQKVPEEYFEKSGERKPYGFEFYYRSDNAEYGVGVTTDGTIPQFASLKEAARVAESLQMAIFGVPAQVRTRDYAGNPL